MVPLCTRVSDGHADTEKLLLPLAVGCTDTLEHDDTDEEKLIETVTLALKETSELTEMLALSLEELEGCAEGLALKEELSEEEPLALQHAV